MQIALKLAFLILFTSINFANANQLSPELFASPSRFDFNPLSVGDTSNTKVFVVTNNGTKGRVCSDISLGGVNADDFVIDSATTCEDTIAANSTCDIHIKAMPLTPGEKEASLIYSCDGSDIQVSLSTLVHSPNVSIFPRVFDFGKVIVGGSSTGKTLVLSNNGQGGASGCTAPTLEGDDADQFEIISTTCTESMNAGSGCTVDLRALPTLEGNKLATLERACEVGGVVSTSINVAVPVQSPELVLTPSSFNFGTTVVNNQSAVGTFTFSNIGTGPTHLCSMPVLTGRDSSQFVILTDNCVTSDLSPEGGSCSVDVVSSPTSEGIKSATLTRTCLIGGTARTNTNAISATAEIAVPNLAINQSALDFSNVLVSTNSSLQTLIISNSGNAAATGCAAPVITGEQTEFTVLGSSTCNTSNMPTGGSCTIDVQANPTTTGAHAGTASVTCAFGGTLSATLAVNGVAPILGMSPLSSDFSQVIVGQTSAPTLITITNTGTAAATSCSAPVKSGANTNDFTITNDLCGTSDLGIGASCTFEISAAPTSRGAKTASVNRNCVVGGLLTTSATVQGIGAVLAMTPISNDFGSVNVNASSALTTFTISNTGDSAATTCNAISMTGGSSEFDISNNTCLANDIPAGGSCSVDVSFGPNSSGAKSATLSLNCAEGGLVSSALSGTATAPSLAMTPISHDYGQVDVNTASIAQTFTITNTGDGSATSCVAGNLTGVDAANFSIDAINSTCTGVDIPAGGTCTIIVTSTPLSVGVLSNASVEHTCSTGGNVQSTIQVEGMSVGIADLAMTPATFNYADTEISQSSIAQQFVITNNGTLATTTCASPQITGTNLTDFVITANTCTGNIIAPAATCSVDVNFSPTAPAEAKSASLFLDCVNSQVTGTLAGNAISTGTITPGTISFAITSPSNPVETFIFSEGEDAGAGRTIDSITWDFGDGTLPVTLPFNTVAELDGDNQQVYHNFVFAGATANFTVTKTITDDLGNTNFVSQLLVINKGATPIANYTLSQTVINAGDTITIDATASSDPDGNGIALYRWFLGDDFVETTNPILNHTFNIAGENEVGLMLVDNDRHVTLLFSSVVYVDVAAPANGQAPQTSFTMSDALSSAPFSVTVDAAPYSFDLDGTIADIIFDISDKFLGKRFFQQAAAGPAITIPLSIEGNYRVNVVAQDNLGNFSPEGDATKNAYLWTSTAPVAEFFASKGPLNNVDFDASATRGAASTDAYFWDFGDGKYSFFGDRVTNFYDTDGTKTITLTVFGADGTISQKSKTIFIANSTTSPNAFFANDSAGEVQVGTSISFDGLGSVDNETGGNPSITIDLGDGSPLLYSSDADIPIAHIYSGSSKWIRPVAYIENFPPPTGNGLSTKLVTSINIVNGIRPTSLATANPPAPGFGVPVVFDATASTDDGTIVKYIWEVYETGVESPFTNADFDFPTSVHFGSTFTKSFQSNSSVRLYLEDDAGNITRDVLFVNPSFKKSNSPLEKINMKRKSKKVMNRSSILSRRPTILSNKSLTSKEGK